MSIRKFILASSAVLPVLLSTSAFAQTSTLDEIVVTAQKRTENQQDVPLSITTMDPETLNNIFQGGEDIRALATRIPGLYAESSNGRVAPRFYIRGLGNTDFDLAASQPVSIIMDDIVQENVVLKSFPLFDIERVEVLRGPQGSLFGRNTPAGLVKFDTAKPTDTFGGYGTISYGRFDSVKAEGAVGGPIVEDVLSARISGLLNRRSDWIDNGFTGERNAFGGFEDIAGRLQVLWTPTDAVDVLFNVHARDLDGTSALFRANIIGPGNNNLNENFDRDVVFLDGGDGNNQAYKSEGGSVKVNWDIGTMTFTSITGYETADGFSRGDIDGGAGVGQTPNTGFIPFPSDTQDGIDDTNQFTQEFRLTSNQNGPLNWQIGAYYFDSDLTITTNPFFVPATTVRHDNTAWSIFGQASYQLNEHVSVSGGLRYTDDEKDFEALASNFPVAPVNVSDDQFSWDASINYQPNDTTTLFARVARGFRAPTIQGRDVAFFSNPSTASSETIQSYEVGYKLDLIDNRVRWNGTAYYYDANDLQFSAIGGGGNLNQLVNADGEGYGFEMDLDALLTEQLLVRAGFSFTETEITEDGLRVAPCGGGCTVLDPIDANGNALIQGNPFPQAPEVTFNFSARYGVPLSNDRELYIMTDWAVQGDTNFFLYESAEFNSDTNVEGGARIGYRLQGGTYEIAGFVRNITDAENLKGGIDFNNLTGFVNEPRTYGIALTGQF